MPSRRRMLMLGLIVVALSLPAGAARSQGRDRDTDRQPGHAVELLDTGGDGKVQLSEIVDEHNRLFGAADVNGDGKLSVEEFRRRGRLFMSLRTTSMFDLLDSNGDRTLTPEEVAAPAQRWFLRYDANGDGALETSELPHWGRGGDR